MKKFAILISLLLVVTVSSLLIAAEPTLPTADKYMKIYADYEGAKTDGQKLSILQNLAKEGTEFAHITFYKCLHQGDAVDLPIFSESIKENGTVGLILGFASYLGTLQDYYDLLRDAPGTTDEESAKITAMEKDVTGLLQKKIEVLLPAFGVIARKNPKPLVDVVEKFIAGDGKNRVELMSAWIGVGAMEEDGAAIVLKLLGGEGKGKNLIISLTARSFGRFAVVSALKQYENPASTKAEKDAATSVFLALPDNEFVYAKVVEAYKHGRYFPVPGKKDEKGQVVLDNPEEMVAMAMSSCGRLIEFKYKTNEKFMDYVVQKHLLVPPIQGGVITLLARTNLKYALLTLMALDLSKLPDLVLEELILQTYLLPGTWQRAEAAKDEESQIMVANRFFLFRDIFSKLSPEKRAKTKLVYGIGNYPADMKADFVEDVVRVATKEEKKTLAILCGKKDPAMPEKKRQKILDILAKDASPELRDLIKSMKEEK